MCGVVWKIIFQHSQSKEPSHQSAETIKDDTI